MVYCAKCGTKNEEEASVCAKCGQPLHVSTRRKRRSDDCFGPKADKKDDECFGLPHGGAIAGIVFGIIIVLLGLAILTGFDIWAYIGPLIIVVVGILIVAGAIYGMQRR
ncbi:MAG: zinc-ribbon domain-containing protein [Candidatus Bathyarchaeota archaeon]|nr:MAG: zinc-ribbon domain-containing protein [Candidatus Bathyarchaeota archaeon]